MKKVVITGASSFIGANLCRYFAQKEFVTIGTISAERESYSGIQKVRLEAVEQASAILELLDVTQPGSIRDLIERHKPDLWVHLAAWTKNYGSLDYDLCKGFEVGVAPLTELFQGLAQSSSRLVLIGSDAEYTSSASVLHETSPTSPVMPYGLAKLSVSIRAEQLALQYGVKTRLARAFLPYGTLDNPGKLIPSVIDALGRNEKIDLSPCLQERDFLYIGDLVQGIDILGFETSNTNLFDVFNVCSSKPTQLKEFLQHIAERLGKELDLLDFGARQMRAGEAPCVCGSNEKMISEYGWNPMPLEKGIAQYLAETQAVGASGLL